MVVGEDRNKNRCKNWQLCGVWNLPFCDHRPRKLTQTCVCFTNLSINLLVLPSVTPESWIPPQGTWTSPLAADCSALPLTCSVHWLVFCGEVLPRCLVLICVSAWSHAAENRWSICWRSCLDMQGMGVERIFSRGGFLGVPKVVKFVFSHSKLRKQPFFAIRTK